MGRKNRNHAEMAVHGIARGFDREETETGGVHSLGHHDPGHGLFCRVHDPGARVSSGLQAHDLGYLRVHGGGERIRQLFQLQATVNVALDQALIRV